MMNDNLSNATASKWWLLAVFLPLLAFAWMQYEGAADSVAVKSVPQDGRGFTAELARTMSYGFLERSPHQMARQVAHRPLRFEPARRTDNDDLSM